MSRPIRWGLLALALVAGWMHFGERLQPLIAEWAAPIEPAEFSDYRGDPEPITAPGAAARSGFLPGSAEIVAPGGC